ncbi:hypothetical protein EN829_066680, partial [Mesorhizobium sp. M00.F.Ca.ET.186.01.1.1]
MLVWQAFNDNENGRSFEQEHPSSCHRFKNEQYQQRCLFYKNTIRKNGNFFMALLQSERLTVVMQRNTAPEGESAMNKKWVYAIISLLVFCLGACSNQHPGENKESGQSEPK